MSEDDENAAELQFGPEFSSDIQYLSNDEAFFILNQKAQEVPVSTEYSF
jgi:hypothetical protein